MSLKIDSEHWLTARGSEEGEGKVSPRVWEECVARFKDVQALSHLRSISKRIRQVFPHTCVYQQIKAPYAENWSIDVLVSLHMYLQLYENVDVRVAKSGKFHIEKSGVYPRDKKYTLYLPREKKPQGYALQYRRQKMPDGSRITLEYGVWDLHFFIKVKPDLDRLPQLETSAHMHPPIGSGYRPIYFWFPFPPVQTSRDLRTAFNRVWVGHSEDEMSEIKRKFNLRLVEYHEYSLSLGMESVLNRAMAISTWRAPWRYK
ncbi:hypothetical protein HY408_01500 [Candidatus Gottesmanbacteria bacterium]|nr:hypothetical protein [Candidatus Gottesmanbacteria bacterium]